MYHTERKMWHVEEENLSRLQQYDHGKVSQTIARPLRSSQLDYFVTMVKKLQMYLLHMSVTNNKNR